jgi:hypothetical protein
MIANYLYGKMFSGKKITYIKNANSIDGLRLMVVSFKTLYGPIK